MDEQVAILLCTFNGEKYLQQQLDSIMDQTYSNYICYVHDDSPVFFLFFMFGLNLSFGFNLV